MAHTTIKAYYYRQREGSITTSTDEAHIGKRFADYVGIMLRLRGEAISGGNDAALFRRVDQMAMDIVYNTITTYNDRNRLEQTISLLRTYRLFPLRVRFYTSKYMLFALLTRFGVFRSAIFKLLAKR